MSDCDDEIVIAETYSDALSVEVLGYNGNDRIVLGDKNRPLETIIFANIILDGGEGSRDVLVVNDQGTTTAKPIEVQNFRADVSNTISRIQKLATKNISCCE